MWWQKRSRQNDVSTQLAEMTQYLKTLTNQVSEHRVHITVESLHVDQASLEKLVFQLDNLDIQELSGSLNLGNNFSESTAHGVKPAQTDLLTKRLLHTKQPAASQRATAATGYGGHESDRTTNVNAPDKSDNSIPSCNLSAPSHPASSIQATRQGYAIRF